MAQEAARGTGSILIMDQDQANSEGLAAAIASESAGNMETADTGLESVLEALRGQIQREEAKRTGLTFKMSQEWRAKYLALDETHPTVSKAAISAEMFAKKWIRDIRFREDGVPRTWLILASENGVGKTHIARKLYQWAGMARMTAWDMGFWDHPPSRVWVYWPDLVESEADGVWQDAIEADFLVVDEIGAEVDRYKSGLPAQKLTSLLGRREKKWTVVTSNIAPGDWSKHWDKRVADRLRRCGKVLDFHGVKPYSTERSK